MALGRAITKKGSKYGLSSGVSKAERRASVSKIQISAPVELISTTNMISYTSPSLRASMSHSSMSSGSSGGISPTFGKYPSSPSSGSETELSSPDEPHSPPLNHLSTYFSPAPTPTPLPQRTPSSRSTKSTSSSSSGSSISSTTQLGRSSRNKVGPPSALHSSNSRSGRASRSSVNPFGAELAKVAEIAEELVADIRDSEEEYMYSRGLQKFSATDYTCEIGGVFEDELPVMSTGWI